MSMSHVLAVAVLVGALIVWVGVQAAWRRTFPRACSADPDVLAGRRGCHGCDSADACEREGSGQGRAAREEMT